MYIHTHDGELGDGRQEIIRPAITSPGQRTRSKVVYDIFEQTPHSGGDQPGEDWLIRPRSFHTAPLADCASPRLRALLPTPLHTKKLSSTTAGAVPHRQTRTTGTDLHGPAWSWTPSRAPEAQ
jgi:hypothetical protein